MRLGAILKTKPDTNFFKWSYWKVIGMDLTVEKGLLIEIHSCDEDGKLECPGEILSNIRATDFEYTEREED